MLYVPATLLPTFMQAGTIAPTHSFDWDHYKPILIQGAMASVITIAVAFAIYQVIIRSLRMLSSRGQLSPAVVMVIAKLLRWVMMLIVLSLILQTFGLLENAWTTMTAVLGLVAIGFVAVWSVLSNTLCSLILLITRPFEIGDNIEIPADNISGKVVNFDLLFTRLHDEKDGSYLQVPNNLFFQKPIRRRHGESSITLDEQLTKRSDTK